MADAGHFAVIQAHLSLKLFCIILVIKLFVKTVEDRSVLLYNVSADVIGGRSSELPLTPLGMEQASIAGMVLKTVDCISARYSVPPRSGHVRPWTVWG